MAKYCNSCGATINDNAIVCPQCGCQVGNFATPSIVINNSNQNQNTNSIPAYAANLKPKNKWVALLLWFFLGIVGGHKFYEGKIIMGIFYIFTLGFFGIGLIIDFFKILFKPNPYYV